MASLCASPVRGDGRAWRKVRTTGRPAWTGEVMCPGPWSGWAARSARTMPTVVSTSSCVPAGLLILTVPGPVSTSRTLIASDLNSSSSGSSTARSRSATNSERASRSAPADEKTYSTGVTPAGARLPVICSARHVGRDLEHWQPAQLLAFREHADTDGLAGAWRLTLTGMTRADVLGLRWSDVDVDAGTVTVRQGRVQLHHGGQRSHVDEPKSEQRRRTVPVEVLHTGTVALLRALSARQAADRLRAGAAYVESRLVVVDALGVPVRPEAYSDAFRRLCAEAGVPVIRLHSVRHSLAFWLHSLGVTPADAAALLGHTPEVHLSTYLPDSGSAGIAAAAAALGRASLQAVRAE